jgi:pyridinium-3,5-biscarboxylic acid mononucleotide sulfurtransferase
MTELKGWNTLSQVLETLESVVIGYSGGVDSGLLAVVATRVLGRDKVKVVLVDSPSLARREKQAAVAFAQEHNVDLLLVDGEELSEPAYVRNGVDRCYFCKTDMAKHLLEVKTRFGLRYAAYGQNADDAHDFRPGIRAAKEAGIRAPLAEAGLTKQDVRDLARHFGLTIWDKPAMPCLSSRIPHGTPVTVETLQQIDQAEGLLAELGLRAFRVRYEKEGARVELARDEWPYLEANRLWPGIEAGLLGMGFAKVWLDEKGLQPGGLSKRVNSG